MCCIVLNVVGLYLFYLCISFSRSITHLPIIAVFVEYLRQFLIDSNQIHRHTGIVVCQKHVSVIFRSFLAQAVSEHGAAATFFVNLYLSRYVANPDRIPHTSIVWLN